MLDIQTPGRMAVNAHPLKRSRPGKTQKTMFCCLCPSVHFGLPNFPCFSCAEPNHSAWHLWDKMQSTQWQKLLDQKDSSSHPEDIIQKKKKKIQVKYNYILTFFFLIINSIPKKLKQMLKSKIMVPSILFKCIVSPLALVGLCRDKVRTTLKCLAEYGLYGRHLCSSPSFSMGCIGDLLFCL